jgi:Ser/Thr protein kinase RdoA (MazF antagonist)
VENGIVRRNRLIPTTEQVIDICRQYNLGNLISVSECIDSTSNINMKIKTSKGDFVIRIFSGDPQRLDFIMETLKNLDNNMVPVLIPLRDVDGKYFSKFYSKNIQVTRFRSGIPFCGDCRQAYSSGKTLRRFHDVLSSSIEKARPRASLYPSASVIREGIRKLEGIRNLSKEQLNLITSLYDTIFGRWEQGALELPSTIVHGDWHQGNLLFNEFGEVSCIMDFDFITRAERIFDVAYALWHFRIYKGDVRCAKDFMDGYGKLTSAEINLLPLEIARINYFFICTSVLSLNPEYEFNNQINQQYPFIVWSLSKEGEQMIKYLCERR